MPVGEIKSRRTMRRCLLSMTTQKGCKHSVWTCHASYDRQKRNLSSKLEITSRMPSSRSTLCSSVSSWRPSLLSFWSAIFSCFSSFSNSFFFWVVWTLRDQRDGNHVWQLHVRSSPDLQNITHDQGPVAFFGFLTGAHEMKLCLLVLLDCGLGWVETLGIWQLAHLTCPLVDIWWARSSDALPRVFLTSSTSSSTCERRCCSAWYASRSLPFSRSMPSTWLSVLRLASWFRASTPAWRSSACFKTCRATWRMGDHASLPSLCNGEDRYMGHTSTSCTQQMNRSCECGQQPSCSQGMHLAPPGDLSCWQSGFLRLVCPHHVCAD